MNATDILILKASVDSTVDLMFADGTTEFVRVIFVFDEESDPDLFYTRLSNEGQALGNFGVPLAEIVSVAKRSVTSY